MANKKTNNGSWATNSDNRYLPNYPIPEVAQYLQLPPATLRAWVVGRKYRTRQGDIKFSEPLISIADPKRYLMSFINLVEVYVLSAIRRAHEVPMHNIRPALKHLEEKFNTPYPLAECNLLTDGFDLFIEDFNHLVNVSRKGQLAIKRTLKAYLSQIERDDKGKPLRIYPLPDLYGNNSTFLAIDFHIAFGRRIITETGIPVDAILERFNAGESIESISNDYGCEQEQIEKAILAA